MEGCFSNEQNQPATARARATNLDHEEQQQQCEHLAPSARTGDEGNAENIESGSDKEKQLRDDDAQKFSEVLSAVGRYFQDIDRMDHLDVEQRENLKRDRLGRFADFVAEMKNNENIDEESNEENEDNASAKDTGDAAPTKSENALRGTHLGTTEDFAPTLHPEVHDQVTGADFNKALWTIRRFMWKWESKDTGHNDEEQENRFAQLSSLATWVKGDGIVKKGEGNVNTDDDALYNSNDYHTMYMKFQPTLDKHLDCLDAGHLEKVLWKVKAAKRKEEKRDQLEIHISFGGDCGGYGLRKDYTDLGKYGPSIDPMKLAQHFDMFQDETPRSIIHDIMRFTGALDSNVMDDPTFNFNGMCDYLELPIEDLWQAKRDPEKIGLDLWCDIFGALVLTRLENLKKTDPEIMHPVLSDNLVFLYDPKAANSPTMSAEPTESVPSHHLDVSSVTKIM